MTKNEIVEIIIRHTCEIMPHLVNHPFQPTDSLKALGANSVDRADVIMMTLDSVSLSLPLVELAKAANIDDLAQIIHAKC